MTTAAQLAAPMENEVSSGCQYHVAPLNLIVTQENADSCTVGSTQGGEVYFGCPEDVAPRDLPRPHKSGDIAQLAPPREGKVSLGCP